MQEVQIKDVLEAYISQNDEEDILIFEDFLKRVRLIERIIGDFTGIDEKNRKNRLKYCKISKNS